MSDWAKLDPGLAMALRQFQQESAISEPDKAITVILHFEGDLAPLETLGFSTATVMGDEAIGSVRFADLQRLAQHPNVLLISAGTPKRRSLDKAARDIRARASTVGTIGGDGLWHADVATGTLTTASGGATGKGVIVAVIDTGIDVSHPMFNKAISPHYDTRILRVWDMGLLPRPGEAGPDSDLLLSSTTYGVRIPKRRDQRRASGLALPSASARFSPS